MLHAAVEFWSDSGCLTLEYAKAGSKMTSGHFQKHDGCESIPLPKPMKVKDVKRLFNSLTGSFTSSKYKLLSYNCQTFANKVSSMIRAGSY